MRTSKFVLAFLLTTASLLAAQTISTIVNFNGANGENPFFTALVQGRDGRLYGTTYIGGANNLGAIIKVNLATNNSIVLHSFDGTNGSYPGAGVTLGTDGNYYGATVYGGSSNFGVLYKITPAGVYTVLHEFSGAADGEYPYGPPIQATDGNFYGATSGTPDSSNNATIYKYTTAGTYSVVYTFNTSTTGVAIYGLIQGSDGLLYTASNVGGANNCGAIAKISTAGVVRASHSLSCKSGPAYPTAPLMQASDGNYYGTSFAGGTKGNGSLYEVAAGNFGVSVRYNFTALSTDQPQAGLIQANDGNLYGATGGGSGYVFFDWNLTSGYTSLTPALNGSVMATLTQDTNGLLYGVQQTGGTDDDGFVFSFDNSLSPFVSFVKSQGHVGAIAQILGQGLTGSSSVTFNGVAATFTVVNDTYMTATVPTGATTGSVVVTTPTGTLTSNKNFTVTP